MRFPNRSIDGGGIYTLTPPHGAGGAVAPAIDWRTINPLDTRYFGDDGNPHKGVEKFDFVSSRPDVAFAMQTNTQKLYAAESYYEDVQNPFEEFRKYYKEEI